MLKFKIDNEAFEKLNDVEKTFYAQAGDGYQLQVEGAADKSKIDEFRTKNIELMNNAEKFKDVDMEKYAATMEKEKKLRNKELIDKGEFDQLLAENTHVMKSDYEAKIAILTGQLETSTNSHTNLISKYEIGEEATKAFAEHKIKPGMSGDVMTLVRNKFSVDNHQVVAKDGETILSGSDGNLTVSEYVGSLDEGYKIQSNGGQGKGNQGDGTVMQAGRSSTDKIAAGLKAKMA